MSFPSGQMQDITSWLVNYFAYPATFRRETKGTFDPVAGKYTGGGTTDYSVTVTPPLEYDLSKIDGTLIQQGDFSVYVADLPVEPNVADADTKDTLVLDGVEYTLVEINPTKLPGGMTAVWSLHCRK